MTTSPIWFGPEKRRLFGWIHLPERAVAGFVLCPPIGIEGSAGYRGLTTLAERLEAAGNVVVRFDYTGTGDSAGNTEDVTSVENWVTDIEIAIELVRSTGVSYIGLIGLRVGALLAAHVAPKASVDALVLWDPCFTGQRFLREQEILGSVVSSMAEVNSVSTNDLVDIPSIHLSRNLAETLAALDLGSETGRLPNEVLVLTRPDRPVNAAMRVRLSAVNTKWAEAPDQYIFFESPTPVMPNSTIDRIAEWCVEACASSTSPQVVPQSPPHAWSATIMASSTGTVAITEHPVTVGPGDLFGMLTEPLNAQEYLERSASPHSVLFVNLAGDRRTGPSRMWVELGRSWASKGIRVLRLDIRGLGDSPPHQGAERYLVYPPGGIDDVIAAAQFLAPEDPSGVLLVGVCSGAYHAAEAAMVLKSKAVWLVNPAVPVANSLLATEDDNSVGSRRRVVRRAIPIGQRISRMTGPVNIAHRIMPNAAWWLLDRLGLFTYAIPAFDPLLEQGTETFLILGKVESVPYVDRGQRALQIRLRSGRLHLEVLDSIDHGLMMSASRHDVARLLNGYVDTPTFDVKDAIIP